MDQQKLEYADKVMSVLMPHAHGKILLARQNKTRLAHYASADTALQIITKKEIWLRDSRCMNDYEEVLGGAKQIEMYFGDKANRDALAVAVDISGHSGAALEALQMFFDWRGATWSNTYIMSFSEHDHSEDLYGRLSMWRAYGRKSAGVALVMNIPFDQISDTLNAWLSPAGYFGKINDQLALITSNITANARFLASMSRKELVEGLFMMLTMAAVCLKHPGFCEEREWRFIHLPKSSPSTFLKSEVVTIDGIPQTVYKMKLEDAAKAGIDGLSLSALLDRIIIGPTSFPYPISDTFTEELKNSGITDAYQRVFVSNIPLRI